MADYNSKYSGEQVEALLDQVASGNAGGGGDGGIAVETDPIFSASPAATITENDKAVWSGKQDAISDLATIRSGAAKGATAVQAETLAGYALEGYVDAEVKALGDSLAEVATSGSYSDLSDKPTFKTINNESIEGSGNITISGGSGEQGPQGEKGDKGDKGDTGVGVQSVVQTTTSNADGGSNVVTVTLTDGTKSTFTVKNGSKGSTGANGTNGTNGKDGTDGDDGATFTPSVDSAGNLSWTNNKGLANPPTVNIKGPKGDAGEGGGGTTETYIADFTMEELRQGAYDGSDVACQVRDLINAMNANKVILVREGTASAYQGVRVLNGYAEDLLYFSIVDVFGEIIYCDGTDYLNNDSFIEGSSLYKRNFDTKQDALVSGENIKTINGESILGSGNIAISGGSSSGGGVETISLYGGFGEPLIIDEMLAEKRYWLYIEGDNNGNDQSIVIGGFEGDGVDDGSHIRHFYAVIDCVSTDGDSFNVSLSLPDVDIRWSTGDPIPIWGSANVGRYELSITQVIEAGYAYYNAVLTSFNL